MYAINYTVSTNIVGSIISDRPLTGSTEQEVSHIIAATLHSKLARMSAKVSTSWKITSPVYNCRFPDFGGAGECVSMTLTVGER